MASIFPMTDQHLIGLAIFAFVTSITPGPNNLMLMASGASFGIRRTLPHMLGIGGGFMLMLVIVGANLLQAFDKNATIALIFKAAAGCYMLWFAWSLATSKPFSDTENGRRPLTFVQAAMFQWVNPKSWAMAVTGTSLYTETGDLASVALVALIFGMINLPSVSLWALLGQELARHLQNPRHLRWFNIAMAGLLVASLIPLFVA